MNWNPHPLTIIGLAMISTPMIAQAKIYTSVEQAQKLLLPNKQLHQTPILIDKELQEKMSKVQWRRKREKAIRIFQHFFLISLVARAFRS